MREQESIVHESASVMTGVGQSVFKQVKKEVH